MRICRGLMRHKTKRENEEIIYIIFVIHRNSQEAPILFGIESTHNKTISKISKIAKKGNEL